jgi:ketosteroid isomerase-like protein
MPADEEQIRTLIERWADAVHRGDLPEVLADHADDIVMFDVPPPYQGLRGLDAYRAAWPPFFRWQASAASFEIESLEVTPVMTSRSRTPCCGAAPARSSPPIPTTGCG